MRLLFFLLGYPKPFVTVIPELLTQLSLFVGCLQGEPCEVKNNLGYAVRTDALYTNLYCQKSILTVYL
jgi:hypothetical protein